MGKSLFLVCLFVLVTFTGVQQSMGQTDYRRFEFFAGYSHNRVDVGPVEDFDPGDDLEFDDIFDEREGFNGFNLAVVGNFHRYIGAKFDYSYHQKSFEFILLRDRREISSYCFPVPTNRQRFTFRQGD
jgi:hypothetical protein